MKITTVLAELNAINQELLYFGTLREVYPTITRMVEPKVNAFAQRNQTYLKILAEESTKLYDAYVEKNEGEELKTQGKYKHQNKITEDGEQRMPVFKDSLSEIAFSKDWEALMAKPCFIEL